MTLRSSAACVLALALSLPLAAQGPVRIAVGDWPDMRGPERDGKSRETGLITTWALNGQNFLWRVPLGGRSTPIVMGNRVYVQNPSGRGPNLQERVMALDADTGRTIWEYKFSLFQSDIPAHRVGWASPAADPDTGNIYALSGGAQAIALDRTGKLLWERSLGEEWAAFTTHGGRTMSPLVDGDLVIVSAAVSNWGTSTNRAHRLIALNSAPATVYVPTPAVVRTTRPTRRRPSPPSTASASHRRPGRRRDSRHRRRPVKGLSFAAKRAINTGVVVSGTSVIVARTKTWTSTMA